MAISRNHARITRDGSRFESRFHNGKYNLGANPGTGLLPEWDEFAFDIVRLGFSLDMEAFLKEFEKKCQSITL